MKIPFFDLSKQYQALRDTLLPSLEQLLPSCAYVGGPYVQAFEKQIAEYLGVKHAITCGNGTDALKLALRGAGVRPGDEVITTPFSFFATSEAIAAVGAVPVFVDIRLSDLNMDPEAIEPSITPKTKAILPVHIFGAPCAMEPINAIAQKHGLAVIEDACQAVGSAYGGTKIGGLGDAACFSFYPTKNLGAFGDGGMITTNSDEIATICRALKSHGAGKSGAEAFFLLHQEKVDQYLPQQASDDLLYDPYKYYNFLIGENSRLDAIQALILTHKLPRLDQWNARRKAIALRYLEALGDTPLRFCCQYEAESEPVYHQFAVLCDQRDALTRHLNEQGIGVGAFYPVALHQQFAHAYRQRQPSLPVAEAVCQRSLCLPIYPELTGEEQEYIIAAVHGFFKE